jgi:hypothetical protein
MELYKDYIGFGIAGNFALHLDQAGEAEDFKNVITEDEAAPKGMFPFYLPCKNDKTLTNLNIYPLSSTTIKLPNRSDNVQAEPEVAIICEFKYKDGKLESINPTHFVAYNDCSIRKPGAKKISEKKNWGENSKGIGELHIPIDKYTIGGIKDNYSIVSFLKRDGEIYQYGEDVELNGYSYLYEKLLTWIKNQINTQKDFGPLEPLLEYIKECNYPKKAIISIGATRYTHFGETNFLRDGDEVFIVLYHKDRDNLESVSKCVEVGLFKPSMSVLHQKVTL